MNYPIGKSTFIWQLKNCRSGNVQALATSLQVSCFQNAFVKIADGEADENAALLPAFIQAATSRGINVWGWQYLYGAAKLWPNRSIASIEADAAIRNLTRYPQLQGILLDPEEYYKRPGASTWAETYLTKLRAAFPALSIGLCSYRYPSLHPELPWSTFLKYSNFHAPQVYWKLSHNPAFQLNKSYTELNALASLPFFPVGSAFSESGWTPLPSELDEFDTAAHRLNLKGISWWCWDDNGIEAHPDFLRTITNHEWDTPTPPPPPSLEQRVSKLEIDVAALQAAILKTPLL